MSPHRIRSFAFASLFLIALPACTAHYSDDAERRGIVKRLYGSTIQVMVSQPDGIRRAGSGVVIDRDETTGEVTFITAGHVLTDRKDLVISVVGKFRKKSYPATLIAFSEKDDLAVLKSVGPAVKPVGLGNAAELGEEVWVVSYPWGRRRTLVTGIVSQVDWPDSAAGRPDVPFAGPLRLIDATVGYGTSGGGVFQYGTGRLLGIVRGYRTVTIPLPGTGQAPIKLPIAGETTVVPVSVIREFLRVSGIGEPLHKPEPEIQPQAE
jgi:serine protease Do